MNGDLDEAEKNEKQAGKTLKSHDLTKILEIKILLKKQKYEQAVAIVRTIRTDDNDYLVNSILLAQALKRQNAQDIELYCKKILEHKKDDKIAITNLYKVYKSNLDWSECKKLLKTIRKYKTLDKMNLKIEDKIVENNLEQQVNTELS
jgi:lipopolysaccharide biosynthesis regulator YciM